MLLSIVLYKNMIYNEKKLQMYHQITPQKRVYKSKE